MIHKRSGKIDNIHVCWTRATIPLGRTVHTANAVSLCKYRPLSGTGVPLLCCRRAPCKALRMRSQRFSLVSRYDCRVKQSSLTCTDIYDVFIQRCRATPAVGGAPSPPPPTRLRPPSPPRCCQELDRQNTLVTRTSHNSRLLRSEMVSRMASSGAFRLHSVRPQITQPPARLSTDHPHNALASRGCCPKRGLVSE